jgi:protein-S-isoprenylcysteine O-methyltransferase Ste14
MEVTILSVTIILVYAAIFAELVFFPVPSVASTYRLFSKSPENLEKAGVRDKVRSWSVTKKIFLLFIPSFSSVLAYCIPLVNVFSPSIGNYLFPLYILEHDFIVIAGIIFMVAGKGLSGYAMFKIRPDNSQKEDDFALKTEGVFMLTRNPISVGMHITLFGLFLAFPSAVLLIGVLIYMGNMHFRILLEEDFLRQKFHDEYECYFQKTKRYIW